MACDHIIIVMESPPYESLNGFSPHTLTKSSSEAIAYFTLDSNESYAHSNTPSHIL